MYEFKGFVVTTTSLVTVTMTPLLISVIVVGNCVQPVHGGTTVVIVVETPPDVVVTITWLVKVTIRPLETTVVVIGN